MQTANIMLALGGDTGNTIPKYGVTAAEVSVLRAIHGEDAVFDISPIEGGDVDRRNRDELARLHAVYGGSKLFGTDRAAVVALFPGAAARVHEDFDELDLDESLFKAVERAKAPPASARKGRKAAPADDIDDMDDAGDKPADADKKPAPTGDEKPAGDKPDAVRKPAADRGKSDAPRKAAASAKPSGGIFGE